MSAYFHFYLCGRKAAEWLINMKNRNGYLALGYACNEKCRCCPLVGKDDREKYYPIEQLLDEAKKMLSYGVTDVTLSGGEPTLHPDFFSIIEFFHQNGIGVHVLSNGERFSNHEFADEFIKHVKEGILTVTTTFHSMDASMHEYQNGTPGSFQRSLIGIQYLDKNNINVSIKHCITADSYRYLPTYIQFVIKTFSPNAEIQLWGIDLNGISYELANKSFVAFSEIGGYLQKAIDLFEASERYEHQVLTINNLPLCMCDSYYWQYFSSPYQDVYVDVELEGKDMKPNSGPISSNCKKCPFRRYCMDAYHSNFEYFGNDIVSVPEKESCVCNLNRRYQFYSNETIGNLLFSPYTNHSFNPDGYTVTNYLTNNTIHLRLKTEQLLSLQEWLTNGIHPEMLIANLSTFELNGVEFVNDWIRKGIIE